MAGTQYTMVKFVVCFDSNIIFYTWCPVSRRDEIACHFTDFFRLRLNSCVSKTVKEVWGHAPPGNFRNEVAQIG